MELGKKVISTSVEKTTKHVQITLDKDMNVPDARPDVEKMIQNKGEIRLEEMEVQNDRIRVKGILSYKGLYVTAEAGPAVHSLNGSFELEEYINADGITTADTVKVTAELDDLNVVLIHSRKLGIRALITFHALVDETRSVHAVVGQKGEQTEALPGDIFLSQMAFHKRDTCRVKGELLLPAGRPNVREIIWEESALRNPEIRLLDGKVQIRGDMLLFFLYLGEEDHVPIQHVEWEIPFQTEVDCMECSETMVGNISVREGACHLEVRPDQDGEERIVTMETILQLDMKGYEEKKYTILKDIYHVSYDVVPEYVSLPYENLIVKNNAKTKVNRRVRLKNQNQKILQMIHVDGSVKIDDTEMRENGIYVEGVVLAQMLFITTDDRAPFLGLSEIFPFSCLVETGAMGEKDRYEMEPVLDQIQGTVLDGEEIELKAVIGLNTIAFSRKEEMIMTDVKETPKTYEELKAIPGIAVYLADREEPVWNVAKAYGAGIEELKKLNRLEGDRIAPGQKILIVKKGKELEI